MKILKNLTGILVIVSMVLACNKNPEQKSCCKTGLSSESPVSAEISDESLFLLGSEWETYHNEHKKLDAYKGKIIVGAMIFTNCPSACPRIVTDIKNIEAALSAAEKGRIQFLLISMDPDRDTPMRMREFAGDHRLSNDWELIRSGKNATMELANVLGVRIKPLPEGGFDHSNIIHILNPEGEIVFQQQGLNVSPEQCLDQIRRLQVSIR